ncbi:MAG: ABC transporter permease [Candidatus Magasanikbacteria bacterium]|nr:ABC transporter permease [Candidatus Magasanikbacteria bacterium]
MNKHTWFTLRISLKQAYTSLVSRKMRTTFTLLGIVIGSAAVVLVMAAGDALKAYLVGQLAAFGTDYIHVDIKVPVAKKASLGNAVSLVSGVSVTTLNDKDLQAIRRIPNVKDGYVAIMGQELVSAGSEIKKTTLYGVSDGMLSIERTQLLEGRFFSAEENSGLAPVVVLGTKVKEKLFGNSPAMEKEIRIRGRTFRVIGLMAARGSAGFFDMDSLIYIPVKTLQKTILGIDHVTFLMVTTWDLSRAEDTAEEIRAILRARHHITNPNRDDFNVTTAAEAQRMLGTVVGGITLLLLALVSIALVVGGVGIMNVMYVSVAERTFEIGLRKAIGAHETDILYQFLLEALALTGIGGLIGAIIGTIITYALGALAALRGFVWNISFTWQGFALAFGFSMVVGVVFGLYPARRAGKLQPVDALRND